MTPRILEYEDGRIKITAEAFAIPEIKALIDKYDMEAEPYLSYIYSMSAISSPYLNVSGLERHDAVVFDIQATLGEFDHADPLLQKGVDKLKSLYMTPNIALAEELAEEIHRFRRYLRDNPLTDGDGGNITDRRAILREIDKYSANYAKVRKQADEELGAATKGDHEVGDY